MDQIAQAALTHLQDVLTGYLPDVSAGSLDRHLLILPRRIKPLGIGSYIGMHDDPTAETFGRYVEAEAEIRVSANNRDLTAINDEIQGITTSLLTTDRSTLRGHGIYQLELASVSEPDSDNKNTRVAMFRIRYEYHEPPVETGDVIADIHLNDLLNPADGPARFIANLHVASLASLEDFLPLTDPDINASSPDANWQLNTAEKRIEQLNNVRGGGLTTASARKAGAQLLIRPGGAETPAAHLALNIELTSDSPDGVGCIFRRLDSDNFYFFLISQRHDYQLFGKKIAGNWSFLDSGGLSLEAGINLSEPQNLKVVALNNHFSAHLNDTLLCEGEDEDIGEAGEAGLLTHGNNAAHFHSVDLIELSSSG